MPAIGLFDSYSYNDLMDVALCRQHHDYLRLALDLPPWDAESVDDFSDCEYCVDPTTFDQHLKGE